MKKLTAILLLAALLMPVAANAGREYRCQATHHAWVVKSVKNDAFNSIEKIEASEVDGPIYREISEKGVVLLGSKIAETMNPDPYECKEYPNGMVCTKHTVLGYNVLEITGNIYTEKTLHGLWAGICRRTD